MFKSNSKSNYEKNTFSKNKSYDKYNLFSSGDKKQQPLIFKSLKTDFPELSNNPKQETRETETEVEILAIKFNEIVKTENKPEDNDESKNRIPQGYVSYSLGKQNKIDIEYGPNTEPLKNVNDPEEELSATEIMNIAIDIIVENMERYKIHFIERNGEDEYNRIYNYNNKDINYSEYTEEENEEYYISDNEDMYD